MALFTMCPLCLLMLLASYLGLVVANLVPSNLASTYATATTTSLGQEPSFNITSRRRTNNCNQYEMLKKIEAQAWADAGALASLAAEYDNGNEWQPAMNYWMGYDSTESENFRKIQCKHSHISFTMAHIQAFIATLQNQKSIHNPNRIFPEAVVDIYCGDTHPSGEHCLLKNNPLDPGGPKVTPFALSWIEKGYFWNSYVIVLCDRFFLEKESLESILFQMKYEKREPRNASEYERAWGHTIYHELAHLDQVSDSVLSEFCNILILEKPR